MDKQMTIKEALQVAINEEIKAYNLYMNSSKKVANASTKMMLEELANMESGHRKLLENIIEKGKYAQLGKHVPEKSHGIAEFLVTSELKKNASPQEVMIFAMKEEVKAFNFYNDMKNSFVGTELEDVFSRLAAEEKGHKIRLEEEYDEHIMWEN